MRDALEAAQVAAERAPKDAEAWWLLGSVARHCGLPQASDQAFQRAAALSRRKPVPIRVSSADFGALVEGARAELSPDARRRLEATEILIASLPSEGEVRAGVRPDAVAHRLRKPKDVLTIYQVNAENRSASEAELRALVAKTLARA